MSDASVTPKDKKKPSGRKIIKTGKDSGRLTDMGQIALEEAEKIKAKEKKLAKETQKAKKKATPVPKKAKKRGKKYQKAKKKIKVEQFYPLKKAVKLVKETSFSQFNGKVELHLTVKETGLKLPLTLPYPPGKEKKVTLATEKKFPLIHLVIGKVNSPEAHLTANLETIFNTLGLNQIRKAVLASTMGPGVKIKI